MLVDPMFSDGCTSDRKINHLSRGSEPTSIEFLAAVRAVGERMVDDMSGNIPSPRKVHRPLVSWFLGMLFFDAGFDRQWCAPGCLFLEFFEERRHSFNLVLCVSKLGLQRSDVLLLELHLSLQTNDGCNEDFSRGRLKMHKEKTVSEIIREKQISSGRVNCYDKTDILSYLL